MSENESGRLAWRGWIVRGDRGETIGKIEEIYVADKNAAPDWALVRNDSPGGTTSFLPLLGSRSEGNEVIVPFTRAQVTHAPYTEETNRLSFEQGAALYDYYGISEVDRSSGQARLDGAWERAVAAEQKLAAQLSRAWQQWLSHMPGHDETLRSTTAASKRRRLSIQSEPQQGDRHEDDNQR